MQRNLFSITKYAQRMMSAFTMLIGLAVPAYPQDAFPFLEPDAVRAAYESAKAEWTDAPQPILDAFLSGEDRNFYERPSSRSTITQSITNWYPERGGPRYKAVPFAIARALSHDEILDWYIHGIFLGQGCFGVDGAAIAYFGKEVNELDLHEAAFLASLPIAPMRFHPIRNHDRAMERRNHVLSEMTDMGFISGSQAQAAKKEALSTRNPLGTCQSQ